MRLNREASSFLAELVGNNDDDWSEEDEQVYSESLLDEEDLQTKKTPQRLKHMSPKLYAYDIEKLKNAAQKVPKTRTTRRRKKQEVVEVEKSQEESMEKSQEESMEKSQEEEEEEEECTICYVSTPKTQQLLVSGCNHKFCVFCISKYLESKLSSVSTVCHVVVMSERESNRVISLWTDTVYGVVCPERGCKFVIDTAQLQEALRKSGTTKLLNKLEQKVFEEYFDAHLRREFPKCPNCVGIALPQSQHELEVEIEDKQTTKGQPRNFEQVMNIEKLKFSPMLECVDCHKMFCCKCGKTHYGRCLDGITQGLRKDFWPFVRFLADQNHYRMCPTCCTPIEKNGGCDHMVCGKCKSSFSWGESLALTRRAILEFIGKFSPQQLAVLDKQRW